MSDKSDPPDAREDAPIELRVLANHEYRLALAEHDIAGLQGRIPKRWWKRILWFLPNLMLLAAPIVGGYAALFNEGHTRNLILFTVLAFLMGNSLMNFYWRVALGSRPHRSILVEDHR